MNDLTPGASATAPALDTAPTVVATPAAPARLTPLSDDDLAFFQRLLLDKRRAAIEDIGSMKHQLEDAREQAENDTAYSFHMADAGTDAMEREKLYLMLARQQKYVAYIDRALERVRLKTYGVCKVTGKPIERERLLAVPHTETSMEAKIKQKA